MTDLMEEVEAFVVHGVAASPLDEEEAKNQSDYRTHKKTRSVSQVGRVGENWWM